jgi:hypothetical protein
MPGVGVIPNVMKFIVGSETGHTAAVPVSLRPVEVLPETSAVLTRTFELRKMNDPCGGIRWTINGLMWDDITEFPVLGTTEIWSFINRSGVAHPMHPHLVHVQVLDRQTFTTVGDSIVPTGPRIPPPNHERGWKDTFRTDPNQITRVIMKFTDYEGLFAYHCHMLEHEDHEMMRQFQTVPAVAVPLAGPPGSLALRAVGANPFQPPARIEFTLPASEHVKLAVFDLGGRRVRSLLDGDLAGGTYRWYWDGADDQQRLAAPGLYVVRLAVGREVATLKLMMVR